MKRRLIKEFNKNYFKTVPNAKKALQNDSKQSDFNKKSIECVENTVLLSLLSDLAQVENNNIIKPYSETLTIILWKLSEANVAFKKAFDDFPESVKKVAGELSYLSDNACFVGGCVRDVLINQKPHDFDFCTDTNYDLLKRHFEKAGYSVQEKGKEFLVLIVSKDNNSFEIANFRKDSYKKKPKYVRKIK